MTSRVDAERAAFIRDIQEEKAEYEKQLRADPNDKAAKENLRRTNSILRRFGVNIQDTPDAKTLDRDPFARPKPYTGEESEAVKDAMKKNPKPYEPKDEPSDMKMILAKDGGMARGKGGKMYQHNYATGGSVQDNLKQPPAGNEGLKKLPKDVRNKMGYMKSGGMAKK